MSHNRGSEPQIQITSNIAAYFEREIIRTAQKQRVTLSPFASQYLAKLLSKFTNVKNYLVESKEAESGSGQYPNLALLWLEGLSQQFPDQLSLMQHLGDVALFTSGFFAERINRSLVDMDYYRAMGGRAYERAGKLRETLQSEHMLNVFFELAAGFGEFVDVFAEISEVSLLQTDQSLLKLYEKWLSTRSARIARMLAEKGVIAGTSQEGEGN
jgi:hypothetical protein